jgi:hypothetical protein
MKRAQLSAQLKKMNYKLIFHFKTYCNYTSKEVQTDHSPGSETAINFSIKIAHLSVVCKGDASFEFSSLLVGWGLFLPEYEASSYF